MELHKVTHTMNRESPALPAGMDEIRILISAGDLEALIPSLENLAHEGWSTPSLEKLARSILAAV